MSLTSNIDFQKLQSFSKESLFLGINAYQIQTILSIASTATYYVTIDPTALNVNKSFGLLSLAMNSSAGLCLVYTYKSAITSQGTELVSYKLNELSTAASATKIYLGSTPTITDHTSVQNRAYLLGSKGTNQTSGGGSTLVDVTRQVSISTPIVIKFINQESATNLVSLGITWFEF